MSANRQCFYLVIPDLAHARGKVDALSFSGTSADTLASALQSALREPALWLRWKAMQADPDAVDASLGACDPQATVTGQQADLHSEVQVTTTLPHAILKHRLGLLIGANWTLRDVQTV
jgi:hypothetical protein